MFSMPYINTIHALLPRGDTKISGAYMKLTTKHTLGVS